MLEIIELFYKKCLKNKADRKYYNTDISSWKFLLIINSFLMLLFFLGFDKESRFVQLIQVILSGIFISILTYIATIVIPERNRVKRILKTFENELHEDIGIILLEADNRSKHFYFLHQDILLPQLQTLEISFALINREIGILRCFGRRNGLFSYIDFLKKETNKLSELLKNSENNNAEINKLIIKIRSVYRNEIIRECNSIRKHYFFKFKPIDS